MSGNSTPLLCSNNPDNEQMKTKLLPWKQLWGIWKRDAHETQAETSAPDLLLSAVPFPLLVPCFPEQTLTCSSLVEDLYWTALNQSQKEKKMYLHLPAPLLCLWRLSSVLVMVGIKPNKIKLQKTIKFSTFCTFVVSECCMFSSNYLPKQQSHLLFDLCKLKQVWSSLGSELWLHLLAESFIQAILTQSLLLVAVC